MGASLHVRLYWVSLVTVLTLVCAHGIRAGSPSQVAAANKELSISGRITDDRTRESVPRARLLVRDSGSTSMQLADEQGRFSVQIRSGAGVIEVRKVGYLTAIIPLAEPFADPLNVSLTRGAAITGRVTDSTGRSVVAVTVGLRRETASDNDGEVIKAGIAVTDDRGLCDPRRAAGGCHSIRHSAGVAARGSARPVRSAEKHWCGCDHG